MTSKRKKFININDPLPIHEDSFEVSPARYDPSDHDDPIECPYCGKSIPSDINFCYYCGKSLAVFKRVDPVRRGSLDRIDKALAGLGEDKTKATVVKIRDLTDRIFGEYINDPEDYKESERFTDYYLPKTVSAIEHYQVLCSLENLNSEQRQIKAQLEEALGTLSEAFGNILNRISTEGLYDISTDISVVESILKQEGLTDPDFTVSPSK